jgi:hypothetical protein
VLLLDGEIQRLVLSQVRLGPDPLEELQAEIAPQRLLDDLAVAATRTSRLTRTARNTRPSGVTVVLNFGITAS